MRLAELRLASDGHALVARLDGEVDLSNARDIGPAIWGQMTNQALVLVLDLSDLRYVDSTGVELVYQLRERLRARGQRLLLVVPARSPMADALRLAGVSHQVDTVETLDGALGLVRRTAGSGEADGTAPRPAEG